MGENIRKEKLWSKNYVLAISVSVFIQMLFIMTNTTMAKYVNFIGGSNSLGGFTITIFTITALFFRPISGKLLDTKGRRTVLIIGAAIMVVAFTGYNFSYAIVMVLLMRMLHGMGFSGASSASITIASDVIPESRLTEGVGIFGIAGTIANSIGPALAMFLISNYGFGHLFVVNTIIAVLVLVFSLIINYESKNKKPVVKNPSSDKGFIEKTSIPVALVTMIFVFGTASVSAFLYMYASTRGIINIGIFFTVSAITVLCVRLFISKIIKFLGFSKVTSFGILFGITALIILSISKVLGMFLIAAVFYGLGTGIFFTVMMNIIIKVCPGNRRGAALSMYYAAADIGMGVGALTWGFVSQFLGYSLSYVLGASCMALALIMFLITMNKGLNQKMAQKSCDVPQIIEIAEEG